MEATAGPALDASQTPANLPAKPGKALFTSENAAEMAHRAAIARKRNFEAEQLRRAHRMLEAASIKSNDEFIAAKLTRVRAQIALLDDKLESSKDPKDMKMCADALARLYEVESYLSGRPKPGSRRPGREKPMRQTTIQGPLDD